MLYFGVDYYPEQWPEERWPEDARLMQRAGFNLVRLAEFAWSRLEPRADELCFDWLDRALEVLSRHGLRAVLGTPTASPPPWLCTAYPEIFRVREDGLRVTFGHRRQYCPNRPVYRHLSRRIVSALADHYHDHPAVTGWQIDNEFGDRCYCEACRAAFHAWLQRRYGSLEELNNAWGTIFWSQVYTDWSEIPLPLGTGGVPNPGLDLDFRRFMSDSYVSYQQEQVDILRARCPQHFVTHNFMGFGYDKINYFDLARGLDLVAWDNYPLTPWQEEPWADPAAVALSHDTVRGLKGRNFWVLEEQSGAGGWQTLGPAPRPGEVRLWAYQAIAHGADAIVFFRWRTARFGTEQYWHGILDHDARPRRRYDEVKRMGEELARLGRCLAGGEIRAEVALILSYDSRFAFQGQPHNPAFSYPGLLAAYYRALHRRNMLTDIVPPEADLSRYKIVFAPALHVVTPAMAENLRRYVCGGGTLLLTCRSGVKDASNAVVNLPLPGLLADLCGVEVEEYASLPAGSSQPLVFILPGLAQNGHRPLARVWCDVLDVSSHQNPDGGRAAKPQVVACYTAAPYAGRPAITLNRAGEGRVIYVGTVGDDNLCQILVDWLTKEANLQPLLATPAGVEVTARWYGERERLLFILNHRSEAIPLHLEGTYRDLVHKRVLSGLIELPAREVLILGEDG
jgi:beta-galactosidase